jgi:aryl hydrocarbon receptor nuclear translocator
MSRTSAGIPKSNQNASPTPAASQAWAMRQQTQSESYTHTQYSQLSPSRSPSGPTYTQLSSGINSRPSYHTAASAQQQGPQPGELIALKAREKLAEVRVTSTGYYGWPHSADGSGPSAAHNTTVPAGQHPQQGQELSEMLQMLGDQGGPATFEDLNIHMFSGQFE